MREAAKWPYIKQFRYVFIIFVILICLTGGACGLSSSSGRDYSADIGSAPVFNDQTYSVLNNNIPEFTDKEKSSTKAFERYSELDSKGRCGIAYANICRELMPVEERGSIGMVKPSGWHLVKYDNVDGKYLYNRCHLIAFMLAGENANEKNLITGTRYFNVNGMLPFENMVSDYVHDTGNHVLYRVTPVFEGDNLVASGVKMEAWSVEDNGRGICFNVFVHNIQPGIYIDYKTGESHPDDSVSVNEDYKDSGSDSEPDSNKYKDNERQEYVINKNTRKFHFPTCSSVNKMKPQNKKSVQSTRDELIEDGYEPCKSCNP